MSLVITVNRSAQNVEQPMKQDAGKSDFEQAAEHKQLSIAQELWVFITENKAWWMIPIVTVLALAGLLVILGSTGAAPFIYTLF